DTQTRPASFGRDSPGPTEVPTAGRHSSEGLEEGLGRFHGTGLPQPGGEWAF
ncbi:hypothetical protein T484DRAFT_1814640, partial [Baffinella frigidus]